MTWLKDSPGRSGVDSHLLIELQTLEKRKKKKNYKKEKRDFAIINADKINNQIITVRTVRTITK